AGSSPAGRATRCARCCVRQASGSIGDVLRTSPDSASPAGRTTCSRLAWADTIPMKQRFFALLLLPLLGAIAVAANQQATPARPCIATAGRIAQAFHGELRAGHSYEQRLGRFTIRIRPDDFALRQHPKDNPNLPPSGGWHLGV